MTSKFWNWLEPKQESLICLLCGGAIGFACGALFTNTRLPPEKQWAFWSSELFVAMVGGIFTTAIAGVITISITNHFTKKSEREALAQKIRLLSEANERFKQLLDAFASGKIHFVNLVVTGNKKIEGFEKYMTTIQIDAINTKLPIDKIGQIVSIEQNINGTIDNIKEVINIGVILNDMNSNVKKEVAFGMARYQQNNQKIKDISK